MLKSYMTFQNSKVSEMTFAIWTLKLFFECGKVMWHLNILRFGKWLLQCLHENFFWEWNCKMGLKFFESCKFVITRLTRIWLSVSIVMKVFRFDKDFLYEHRGPDFDPWSLKSADFFLSTPLCKSLWRCFSVMWILLLSISITFFSLLRYV